MSSKILLFIPVFGVLVVIGASQLAQGDSTGQIPDNSQISISDPIMVDTTGHAISSFQVGQQIGVQSMLTNHEAHDQRFTYVVDIINKNHVLDYFEGFSASMLSNQSFTVAQIWTPKEAGTYTVMAYVLDSLASAALLSDLAEKKITVQASSDATVLPATSILKSSASTTWFEYIRLCCNGTAWENKYPAPYDLHPEFIKIKDYFNGYGITVIKSMQTHESCGQGTPDHPVYCTHYDGKPLYSYYLLVNSSDENKMLGLGFKKVDAIPPDVSTAGD